MAPPRNLHWPSFAILATGLLLSVGPTGILAQSTNASCESSFDWMNNGLGQSPCFVSAYLQAACNGGQFTVDALPPDTHYIGPYVDQINECQCSSVTYNTISACGLCQNATIISWTAWNLNCTTIYTGVFLPGIPVGTEVPAWAFQDVTASNMFNATLALSAGANPESTPTIVQTTDSVAATSTGSAPTDSPTTSSGASSGSTSNTGAIAGGVVGGVVGAALIVGVVVFFVMKKKHSQNPPPAAFAGRPTSSVYPSASYTDATLFSPPMAQPKLYDPSDPSTFPVSPPPTTITSGSSNNIQSSTVNYSSYSVRPGYYRGAPEI